MTHLTGILKWTHRRETMTTAGTATRESNHLMEANGSSFPSGSWPETFINPRGGNCVQSRKLEFRCAMRQHSTPVFLTVDFTGIRCACDLPVFSTQNGQT